MPTLHALAGILVRAVELLALAAAPPAFSPAPVPPASPMPEAAGALIGLALVAAGAARVRRLGGRGAIGAGLIVAAEVAAIGYAALGREPLGLGLAWVAPPLWIGLSIVAGETAERRRSAAFHHPRLAAATAVLCGGAALFASQSGWLFSARQMWWQAIRKDGSNAAAVDRIVEAPVRARDWSGALEVLDRCLTASPGSCACLARRAEIGLGPRGADEAMADARAAIRSCPDQVPARVALVNAQIARGDVTEAEVEARAGLALRDDPRLHLALAVVYERARRVPDALAEAKRAVEGDPGRDVAVPVSAMAISAGDLDLAARVLGPVLKADPKDAQALYNLALVADKRNDFNKAREGYLAALRADPKMADARYNLALLTLRRGVVDEARHHAQRFQAMAPDDPRNVTLARLIAQAVSAKR